MSQRNRAGIDESRIETKLKVDKFLGSRHNARSCTHAEMIPLVKTGTSTAGRPLIQCFEKLLY